MAATCEPDMAATEEECKALESKILKEYADFLRDELRGEPVKGSEMRITLKKDKNVRPICIHTAKAKPIHYKEEADKVVKNLLAEDIIERVPPNEPTHLQFVSSQTSGFSTRWWREQQNLLYRPKILIRNLPPGSTCFA